MTSHSVNADDNDKKYAHRHHPIVPPHYRPRGTARFDEYADYLQFERTSGLGPTVELDEFDELIIATGIDAELDPPDNEEESKEVEETQPEWGFSSWKDCATFMCVMLVIIVFALFLAQCINWVFEWRAEHTMHKDPYAKYSLHSRTAPPQSGQSEVTPTPSAILTLSTTPTPSTILTPTPSASPSITAPVTPTDMALFDQGGTEGTAKHFLASATYG